MLSRKTKYGLKALTYIARQEPGVFVQIASISSSENISHKFLEAILLSLKNAGVLGAKKGKGGGYYLLKPADQIMMSDVIRLLEGPIAMLPCVSLNFYEKCDDCPDEDKCAVHRLMIEVRDSTLAVLKSKSLMDLAHLS
jgi:Rrf2 family protein